MQAEQDIEQDIFGPAVRTPEDIAQEWKAALSELDLSAVELADYMNKQGGDYRPYTTILRGIQRMIAGETKVSGEMFVIVTLLLRQHRRLKARHPNLDWTKLPSGALSAKVEDYTVFLSPQTKGRWIVSCAAPGGFSPPFGRWQQGLDSAKNKALACVEEGMNDVAQLEFESRKQ
ncbi:hypothetical protein [Paracoccus sp. (in: a-proteobacteria)]|uniref:hypothetical protein n=1 Tax=Paracoccus sp. TaxID=267 RepID=UPI002AFFFE84|nr:hypothetical protein [Paracoccus sp. (in: a-proteobacteria)]